MSTGEDLVSKPTDQVEKARHGDDHGAGGPDVRGRRVGLGGVRRSGQGIAQGRGRGQVSQRGRRPLVAGGLGDELLQQRGRGRLEGGRGPDAGIVAAHVAADGQRDRGHRQRDRCRRCRCRGRDRDHRHGQGAKLNGRNVAFPPRFLSRVYIML